MMNEEQPSGSPMGAIPCIRISDVSKSAYHVHGWFPFIHNYHAHMFKFHNGSAILCSRRAIRANRLYRDYSAEYIGEERQIQSQMRYWSVRLFFVHSEPYISRESHFVTASFLRSYYRVAESESYFFLPKPEPNRVYR